MQVWVLSGVSPDRHYRNITCHVNNEIPAFAGMTAQMGQREREFVYKSTAFRISYVVVTVRRSHHHNRYFSNNIPSERRQSQKITQCYFGQFEIQICNLSKIILLLLKNHS